ncbi:PREDICTED: uncharacterized protein LOC109218814 isoform X2 [Nicotiana attenuata]|uniref:uncharacterized protein LOC109218814 isoform X2 n=1 Tax=Nicotiana attenuata TaxID=49451 RepID=UPI00090571A8|nr:PREDICTED: uncharacterized protein LOC109218814 isoform X2 [Nicotiana attenuata]
MSRLIEHHLANNKQDMKGTEVFVGGLARTTTESKIHEVFSSCGEIVEIRLIKDQTGVPKGFCFVRFATKYAADKALKEKSGYVLDGKKIGVRPSVEQDTLFLGNLNKGWGAEEFESIVHQVFPDAVSVDLALLGDVQPGQKQQNRGFAFVKFPSHAAAARAFRVGSQSDFLIDGKLHPSVQWAEEPDPNELAQIKAAFVRNLPPGADEDYLKKLFQPFGNVERIALSRKGSSTIGFVYFDKRSDLDNAIKALNEKTVQGPMGGPSCKLQVEVARPMDKNRKRGREDPNMSSTIESHSKLLKDDPNVEMIRAPKSTAQLEMDYSDPYEAAVVALPVVVKERLVRILRLGIATRYDIDVESLTSLKMLPQSAAISILDQFMLSGADMQNKGGYLASLISKQVEKLGLKQFDSRSRIEDAGLRVPEPDRFSTRVRLPDLDSYASRVPLPMPRADVYTSRYSAYLDPHLSGRMTTKRMEEASSHLQATSLLSSRVTTRMEEAGSTLQSLLSGGVTTRRMDEASPILQATLLPSGRVSRMDEASPNLQATWSPSPTNDRIGLNSHITATADHQHTRPRIRFDPFTGEPYKFDPFTGEPIVPESSSHHRSLY